MLCRKIIILLVLSLLILPAQAGATAPNFKSVIQKLIEPLADHNDVYIQHKGSEFFKKISHGQKPTFTIVTCSDSRIQVNVLENNPEGDLFMVRNIGNQLTTSMGSVDYGISHLHTEILLIIGHSRCGAIDAARSDYKNLEPDIVKELDTIHIKLSNSSIDNVEENVNNQVALAVKKYAKTIKNHDLTVIGAVYDFANDMHEGSGELVIININGETNPDKLKKIIGKKINS
jgi:carbonic anhydrase